MFLYTCWHSILWVELYSWHYSSEAWVIPTQFTPFILTLFIVHAGINFFLLSMFLLMKVKRWRLLSDAKIKWTRSYGWVLLWSSHLQLYPFKHHLKLCIANASRSCVVPLPNHTLISDICKACIYNKTPKDMYEGMIRPRSQNIDKILDEQWIYNWGKPLWPIKERERERIFMFCISIGVSKPHMDDHTNRHPIVYALSWKLTISSIFSDT